MKQREQYLYIGCDKLFNKFKRGPDYFELPDDGNVYYIFHQREYERPKKPKTIYALFQFFGARTIQMNPNSELRKYDAIFAQDTNYKKGAVSTICAAKWSHTRGVYTARHLESFSFTPVTDEPEREAWRIFVEKYSPNTTGRCCLLVDSALGLLQSINRREVPLSDGYYLPENWQLNYATSDVKDDFIAVRMIRRCEKENKKRKKLLTT